MIHLFIYTPLQMTIESSIPLVPAPQQLASINSDESVVSTNSDASAENICRVCRSGASPGQELLYPCKCSGSIKYVHEDCLNEWLKHSGKNECELCKHRFTYTPIYKSTMPKRLPITVLVIGIMKISWKTFSILLRIQLLILIWLVIVPRFTCNAFRAYLEWSYPSQEQQSFDNISLVQFLFGDLLSEYFEPDTEITAMRTSSWIWDAILSIDYTDIIMRSIIGLMITILVIMLFLSMVLLREYISSIEATEHARRLATLRANIIASSRQPSPGANTNNSQSNNSSIVYSDPSTNSSQESIQEESQIEINSQSAATGGFRGRRSSLLSESISTDARSYHIRRMSLISIVSEQHDTPTRPVSRSSNISSIDSRNRLRKIAENRRNRLISKITRHPECNIDIDTLMNMPLRDLQSIANRYYPNDISSTSASPRPIFDSESIASPMQPSPRPIENVIQPPLINNPVNNEPNNVNPREQPRPRQRRRRERILNMGAEALSLQEFIGWKGPLSHLAQNAFIVLVCNLVVMHVLFFVPYVIGQFSSHILWSISLSSMLDIVKSYISLPFNIANVFEYITNCYNEMPIWTNYEWISFVNLLHSLESRTSLCVIGRMILGYIVCISLSTLLLRLVSSFIRTRPHNNPNFKVYESIRKGHEFFVKFCRCVTLLSFEILVFPWLCGWTLNICCSEMFSRTMQTEKSFISISFILTSIYFYSSTLIHWAMGTAFMYGFTIFITNCRQVFRPGLLHFVRNPHDPEYSPMKDIITTPIGEHARRLGYSFLVYLIMIFLVTWPNIRFSYWIFGDFTIMSLVESKQHSSEIPLYLLLCHGLLPYCSKLFNMESHLKHFTKYWLTKMSRLLGVGSYFLNNEHPNSIPQLVFTATIVDDQMKYPVINSSENHPGIMIILENAEDIAKSPDVLDKIVSIPRLHDGSGFVYVPNFDRVYERQELKKWNHKQVTISHIQKASIPISLNTKKNGNSTKIEIPQADSNSNAILNEEELESKKYMVVYRPSRFRIRVALYYSSLVLYTSILYFLIVCFPTLIGKYIISLLYPENSLSVVHGHCIGIIVLCLSGFIVKPFREFARIKSRINGWRILSIPGYITSMIIKLIIMGMFVLIIFPLGIGSIFELLLVPGLHKYNETPIMFLIIEWSLGMLHVLGYHVLLEFLFPYYGRIMGTVNANFFWDIWYWKPITHIILPIGLLLGMFVFVPIIVSHLACFSVGLDAEWTSLITKLSHFASIFGPIAIFSLYWLYRGLVVLTSRIRDDAYLLGRRLHNLEERTR